MGTYGDAPGVIRNTKTKMFRCKSLGQRLFSIRTSEEFAQPKKMPLVEGDKYQKNARQTYPE